MTGISGGGCGCGQPRGSGAGCQCGRASATGVIHDGAFTRPTFFDGQLLTADDLQVLATYVRGKDRLHNRHMTGAGVVCGLEVVCSCADRGSVLVRTGYALDCCGNDIVVACDQEVDINELVQSLPHDASCADPCPSPTKGGKKNGNGGKENGNGGNNNGNDGNGDNGKGTGGSSGTSGNGTKTDDGSVQPRRYELVVEYAETPADLLAPYSSGEVTSRECEPSRVREGYRFRLRCASDKPIAPPMLAETLGWCAKAEARLAKLENATTTARGLAGGETQAALKVSPRVEDLEMAERQLRESPRLPQAARLAGMAVRFALTGDEESAERALHVVRDNSRLVHDAVRDDSVALAEAAVLDERVASLSGRLRGLKPTRLDLLLAEGILSGDQVGETLQSVVAEARDWALCWLEQHPGSHCRLLESLGGIRMPADDGPALLAAAVKVTSAVRQILIDCICSAINPPCVPCEDEAVVLAHVTVKQCEVVEICNRVRRHAVTGSALRYWLPMEWLYCEISKACCGEADNVKGLARARQLLGDLDSQRTECGWPERWTPRWYESIGASDDETYRLPARVAELERELTLLRQQLPRESVQTATDTSRPERSSADKGSNAKKAATAKKATSQPKRDTAGGNANA